MKYKLSEICSGITDGSHNPPLGVNKSNFLMLSSKNIYDDLITYDEPRYLTETEFAAEDKRTSIKSGDILMTIVGTVGRTAVVDEQTPLITLQRSVAVLHPKKDRCNSRYLMYLLRSKRQFFEAESHGVAQKGIYLKQLSEVCVNIPDILEQVEIVGILDKIQNIIRIRQRELNQLDNLIKARFVEMFGDCSVNKRLEEFSYLITKGASPKWQGIDYCNEGTLFVTSENVREGYVDLTKRKYLPNKINDILPRSVLKRDDILINIVGASIGRAGIFTSDEVANINQAVALVRIKKDVLNLQFLITFLNSTEAQKAYGFMKKGGARDNLSLKDISDLQIPVFPIEEQESFAAFVSQVDKTKANIQKSLEKSQLLFDSLMQEYFG